MTWLQGAVEESELASRASALQFTNEPPEPGVWQGSLDAIGPGLERGFIEGASALESGFSSLWQTGLDAAAGALLPEPKNGGTPNVTSMEEAAQETLGEGTAQVVQQLRPDPRTTGIAGQLLGEAAAILPRAAIGTLAAGPIGGAVAAGAPAGYSSKQVGMAEGLDESTATIKGAIEGVTVGVGAVLPAAKFVKPVVGDLAIAVGANVGLGVASRGATAELLEQNGYTAQAAQYRAMDSTAMLVDGVLGAAFFGLARGFSPRPSTRQVNAALTESNAQHAELHTAPGIPVDAVAANTHVRVLDVALEQLSRGEPVRLPDDLPGVAFLRRDDTVNPLTDEIDGQHARMAGDDFAARVGRETRQPHAAAASEDFLTVERDAVTSIRPEQVDATELEIVRNAVMERPDAEIHSGFDADNNPVRTTAGEALAEVEAEYQAGVKDAQSFMAAVKCMLKW